MQGLCAIRWVAYDRFMQRPTKFLTICVVALAAALIPAAALAASLPKLAVGDSSRFSVRPHFIELSADGALYVGGAQSKGKIGAIGWSSWGSTRARGSGYLWVNNCKPNCAAGKFAGHKVSISASNVSGGEFRSVALTCTVSGKSKTDNLSLKKASNSNLWFWNYKTLACEKG